MKKSKRFILAIPICVVLLIAFNNCARFQEFDDGGAPTVASVQPPVSEETGSSFKLGLPIALLSADQLYSSMLRVLNLPLNVDVEIRDEYSRRYSALPEGNDLSLINSPALVSTTSLAGILCVRMVGRERGLENTPNERDFFADMKINKGVNDLTEAQYSTAIRSMARQFWGRNETLEELSIFSDFKTEFISILSPTEKASGDSTYNLMASTCAAMLSSLDAISY